MARNGDIFYVCFFEQIVAKVRIYLCMFFWAKLNSILAWKWIYFMEIYRAWSVFFLANDMQKRNGSPQKWSYWNKICEMYWNLWKNNFAIFIFRDIVDLYLKSENWPICLHKWPNYWVSLQFYLRLDQSAFQKILRE